MRRRVTAALATATAAAGLLSSVVVAVAPSASAGSAGTWCTSGEANLAIFGASSETGYGTSGYPANAQTYHPTRSGWVAHLADRLHAEWGTTVENYSHNGALVSDYLPGGHWRGTETAVAELAKTKPSLVLVDLGGNEYWSQLDPATFETNLRALVGGIRAVRPGVDLMFYLHEEIAWPAGGNEFLRQATPKHPWAQYAARILAVALSVSAQVVDMRPVVHSASLFNPDGIHLDDAGQAIVSTVWWDRLASSC